MTSGSVRQNCMLQLWWYSRNGCKTQLAPWRSSDCCTLRANYRLALVKEAFPGEDGKVRRVTIQYKSYRTGEIAHEYRGATDALVTRAVQCLALLVPVDWTLTLNLRDPRRMMKNLFVHILCFVQCKSAMAATPTIPVCWELSFTAI